MFINIVESDTLSGAQQKGKAKYGSDAYVLKCYQDNNTVKLLIASNAQDKQSGTPTNRKSRARGQGIDSPGTSEKINIQSFAPPLNSEALGIHSTTPDYSILEGIPVEKEFNLYEKRIVCFENVDQRKDFCESFHQKVKNVSFIHCTINDQGAAQTHSPKIKFNSANHFVTDSLVDLAYCVSQQKDTEPVIGTMFMKDLGEIDLWQEHPDINLSFAVDSNNVRKFLTSKKLNLVDEIFVTNLDNETNYFDIGLLFATTNTPPSLGFSSADNKGRILILNKETIITNATVEGDINQNNPAYELKQKLSRLSRSIKAINEHENNSYSQW